MNGGSGGGTGGGGGGAGGVGNSCTSNGVNSGTGLWIDPSGGVWRQGATSCTTKEQLPGYAQATAQQRAQQGQSNTGGQQQQQQQQPLPDYER